MPHQCGVCGWTRLTPGGAEAKTTMAWLQAVGNVGLAEEANDRWRKAFLAPAGPERTGDGSFLLDF